MLSVERDRGGNIVNLGDALSWAVTTMTTVRYGDRYPVTGQGRLVAAALMVGGIAILGVATASLASWLVEHVAAAEKQQSHDLQEQLDQIRGQLDEVLGRLQHVPRRDDMEEATFAGPERVLHRSLGSGNHST